MSNLTRLGDLQNLGTLIDNGCGTVHANFMLAQEAVAKLDERVEAATAIGTSVSNLYVRGADRRLVSLLASLEEQEYRTRRVREEVETVAKNITYL